MMNEFLPIIIDAVVIFIFVFYLARGWRKGFVGSLVTMLSFILALILTWQLYGYAADFLRAIGVQDMIAASFGAGAQAPADPGVVEASTYIEGLFLPEALKTNMIGNNNYEAYAALGVSNFQEYVGVFLANMVVNAIALLGVFLILLIGLRLLGSSMRIVNHIPLVGLANRLLGTAANGVIGYFVIQFGMFVCTLLATGQNFFSGIVLAIENSTVGIWFYHANYLIDWIMKIFA